MDKQYQYESMNELLARRSVRSRQEVALRYAALCLSSPPRQPMRTAVAGTLRNLADRFEPAPDPPELVRQ